VGRPSDPGEQAIAKALEEQGCLIWREYFERIQDIYALADCYAFPTFKRDHCIEMPLSVLEAIACNLPVVSTPFGALPRIISAGDGVVYAQTPEDFEQAIAAFEMEKKTWHTRHKVLNLSWANLAHKLESIYTQLQLRTERTNA
jgi:glycosyltransferase involved in cell wall biosynthesis